MSQDPQFKINAKWNRVPKTGERDVAEIGIFLANRALTQLVDVTTGEVRDFVRASAVSLAVWCTDNWWRLRWEPIPDYRSITADWRLRHELTSAPGGTIWPPLMIYGVGDRVVLAPLSIGVETQGPIEYLPTYVSIVGGLAYEYGLDEFFQRVMATCSRAQDAAVLSSLLSQLNKEREDPGVTAWRCLEAKLGFDPDDAPNGLIETLFSEQERIGAEAVEEAAVAHPGIEAPTALHEAIAASKASNVTIDIANAVAVGCSSDQVDLSRPTWMIAEDAATKLRLAVNRPNGPLLNKALSEILKVSWEQVMRAPATALGLTYGARLKANAESQRVALQTRASHDRRFELVRALGDAIWSRDLKFGVISRAKTDRQKFQRAFAQSLLCPFDDLRNCVDLSGPTDEQIETAARRYHVHRSVVRTLLVNKGFLPRETLGEHLEAA